MPINLTMLKNLRLENNFEFRYQLISKLKRIANRRNIEEFKEVLTEFKKELINESHFYIDDLNEILRNILILDRVDFRILIDDFIFLANIGDHYTYDLLKKAAEKLKGHQDEMERLQIAMMDLEEQIMKLEEESEELRLYPMDDIIDKWLD